MSRPVAIRVSYRPDAAFLLRLEAAVLIDGRQTDSWRSKTAQLVRQLALTLLEADVDKKTPVSSKLASKKSVS
jgi:rhodanese-related sulfurtransferase